MNDWNGFDFLIFLIFIVNTLLGMSRAATKEIISMASLSAALICAIKFTIPLSLFFNRSPLIIDVVANKHIQNFMLSLGLNPLGEDSLQEIFYSISLLVCFVGTFSVCEGVLGIFGIVEMYPFPYAMLNRKLGAALGGVRGYVISLILISVCVLHIFKNSDNSIFTNSFFVKTFYDSAVKLDSIISGQRPEQYKDIFKDKNLYNPVKAVHDLAQPASEGINTDAVDPTTTTAPAQDISQPVPAGVNPQ